MPVYEFYIYSASVMTYNSGTGAFDFDAGYQHWEDRYRVVVSDDDNTMNSSGDGNQFATIYDLDGNVVDSGLIAVPLYAEVAAPGGSNYLDRIEINGVHYGYTPAGTFVPGNSYSVTFSGTDNLDHSYYDANSVPCFAPCTLIETERGWSSITKIRTGDLVRTLDHGLQPVLWAGRFELAAPGPSHWPVTISAAHPGITRPFAPLCLSAQHRVLLEDPWCELLTGSSQVLAPAKALAAPQVSATDGPVVWHHLLLARHEVLRANGVWVESLFAGGQTFDRMPPRQRLAARIALRGTQHGQTARPCLTVREAESFRMAKDSSAFSRKAA